MSEGTNEKVLAILENIKKNQDVSEEKAINNTVSEKNNTNNDRNKPIPGKPKSGRFWKSKKDKFSSISKTKGLKQDFQKKTALRLELKRTKELSKQVLEQLKQREIDRKERRRENIKRSEENKRKAEVVQVITNTAKLKRMKKKQLRFIQKRDVNTDVESKNK
ncbi:coiled-coil domain-containing protein 86 [Galleria mellonella]|uniref:Coiled-coil domain-containing protein 86 n=1 Tax=Galleria mellonella TaxID=7137 RepID=A0A6J1WKS4_GALME|nr:coiled-coil domain-containing protein 86 [Galleria mellonella]